jgi:transposase
MRAYSMDLRIRVLEACDSGMGTTEVAETYSVSKAWVKILKKRRRETGEIGPRKQKYGPTPILQGHEDELKKVIEEKPDRTIKEITAALSVKVSHQTVHRVVSRLGYRFKKNL